MKELAVYVDTGSRVPAYEQIYSFIRDEIINGNIKKGAPLPSSRSLAEYLQFSRSTVLMAYEQLIAEGYIESAPRRGYYVSELEEGFCGTAALLPDKASDEKYAPKYRIDFSPDGIEAEHFPYNEWRRIMRQVVAPENSELFNSGDSRGDAGLREVISEYLMESRRVRANPSRIVLGAGNESLLMIISALLDGECVFGMENPAYRKSYMLLKSLGRKIVPVGMDGSGIITAKLEESGADIAYVTPSHQYPTGTVMSIGRRTELLAWARAREGRYIIEDDYDSEFRYKGKPIPALQGNDGEEKVIYIGTFSKSLSPALRISYMVLPEALYIKYMKSCSYFSNTVSRIDQKAVELFIREGGFGRHLGRMRKIYKNKHDVMLGCLRRWKNTEVSGENAGAHMLVRINNGMSGRRLLELADADGIKIYPLDTYYIDGKSTEPPQILLGYARLDARRIEEGLSELAKIWEL
ncbi:MAG: PLP-dependent aminotransferase family protein [Butyrivibrio sp.]|nr:PLP-dependent aminotransferase family protein [Butyrivibrio sp.]